MASPQKRKFVDRFEPTTTVRAGAPASTGLDDGVREVVTGGG